MADFQVLIVDDELEFVTALVERLKIRGIRAEGALRADQAMVKLAMKTYDIILLDIKMPGMKLADTIERFNEIKPGVQIILVTGYGSSAEGEEGLKLGAVDLMAKPIKFDKLIQRMTELTLGKNG